MWYVIAWRDETSSTMTLDIPGFEKWCEDNAAVLSARIDFGLRHGCRITPELLIDTWNAKWPGTVAFRWNSRQGAIACDTLEFGVRVEILHERMAPHLELMDPEENEYWWWHGVGKDGTPQFRIVLEVTQHDAVNDAVTHSKMLMKKWHDKVEDFDTQEWADERRNLRRMYDDFRNWVISQTQHKPPDPEREPS